MTIKPRSAWGARAARSRTAWNLGGLDGVCVHWWGSPRAPDSQAGMPALMRSVQGFHMAPGGLGVPNGGSDIAYNFVIDQWGGVWEGRGWNAQTGANGTSDANRRFISFAVAIGTGDDFTEDAKRALVAMIAEARGKGIGKQVRRHGEFQGTSCPGPEISAWIEAGRPAPDAPRPEPEPDPEPKPQVRYVLTGKAGNVIGRSGPAPKGNERKEKARLRSFLRNRFDDVYTRATRGGATIKQEDV